MIEADSSLTKDGNEYFADCALDVFLHGTNLDGMAELQKIQSEILENIYLDIPGEKHKKINTEFLVQYAEKLKNDVQSASNNALRTDAAKPRRLAQRYKA